MTYDLVVRGGTVVDGSGMPRYRADVAVKDGRVAAIGRISSPARWSVDAEGHVVAPGLVDGAGGRRGETLGCEGADVCIAHRPHSQWPPL